MQYALEETARRRVRQQDFNRQHGITPTGIQKGVQDIMAGAGQRAVSSAAESAPDYPVTADPQQVLEELAGLEAQMYRHARELEFEQAAALRDRIQRLRRGHPDTAPRGD